MNLALPRTGSNVDEAVLNTASPLYPQVVAGIPRSFGFDPATGRFTLVYAAAAAGSGPDDRETDIVVPRAAVTASSNGTPIIPLVGEASRRGTLEQIGAKDAS